MITLRSGGWVRLLFVGCLLLLPVLAAGKTLTVTAGDKGGLSAALDAANPGDVILVGCGVYPSGALTMPDGVTLSGAAGDASCVRIETAGLVALFSFIDAGPGTRMENLTLAAPDGGIPIAVARGGGVHLQNSSPVFSNVVFENLEADYGGAVYCTDGSAPTFQYCRFEGGTARAAGGAVALTGASSPTFEECLFVGNTATASGGTINSALVSSPILTRCTIVNGDAAVGSGLATWDSSNPGLDRVILADGLRGRAWDGGPGSVPTVVCSDIHGNEGGDWVGALAPQLPMDGNISADPEFCGTADGTNPYTLNDVSPCATDPGCGIMGAFGVGCSYVAEVPGGGLPALSRLHDNYPNPFNPRTTISFDLNRSGPVDLAVFDVAGRLVKRLVSQTMTGGTHEAVWEGKDSSGRSAAAGVYFFRLRTDDTVDTKRMTLIK